MYSTPYCLLIKFGPDPHAPPNDWDTERVARDPKRRTRVKKPYPKKANQF